MEKKSFVCNGQKIDLTLRDQADASVAAEIFKLHEYRAADEAIRASVAPVLDVGAHSGMFSLYCRAINPTVPVYAVEPEPNNFIQLQKHLKENSINGVIAVKAALAATTGSERLAINTDSHNHYLVGETIPPGQRTIAVKTYRFRDFLQDYSISRVSLLKMDIEGGEYAVFNGFAADDFSLVNFVIMEFHNQGQQTNHQIEQSLRQHGFSVQTFPSQFDKTMGFIWARNKRVK